MGEATREPYRRSKSSDAEGTSLPPGKTCGDCQWFIRCGWLISQIVDDETCDWAPSRFVESPSQKGRP
jgi:hypothetical protein